MKIGEKKMSVEEYVAFTSGNSSDFTIAYLNQIIHMHGFRKLHKAPKKIVGEAVDSLDLMDLCRSTLKQTPVTSSSSSLTLDEIIDDIEALKWQECCITSLETINSGEITQPDPKPNQKSNKRKKATKKKSMNSNLGNENDGNTMISLPVLPKNIKSKRTKKHNTKRNHISE